MTARAALIKVHDRLLYELVSSENGRMPDDMDEVVKGVGKVCISATSLEWSLAYCASVLGRMGDEWFVDVLSHPGRPLEEFRTLVRDIAVRVPELRGDAEKMLANARRLLGRRNRVVIQWSPATSIRTATSMRPGMRRPALCDRLSQQT